MHRLHSGSLIILDLDDTLYSEREYERSGFRTILDTLDVPHSVHLDELMELSIQGQDVFEHLNFDEHMRSVALSIYRQHTPDISLYPDAAQFLEQALAANCTLAIATEGRSVSQRNKIAALGLEEKVDYVLISEELGYRKVQPEFFEDVLHIAKDTSCIMVGDNPAKDFLIPNRHKWVTYMLADRGNNVHSQDVTVDNDFRAEHTIHSFNEFVFVG